ncbi:class I poly(R)-hydroxyalkanoic acid synthase [Parvularcula sp. ZS-1/3]|uniref:Class I poly(R)-hydroxyalkanoic acid synthase n=1 Tax=Parvularcula mediterranea TaxID=2732508 RepID=A0A7Y3W5Q0_9PROT|nr:class I poly(R)-hydroxyalkanoic acid synthase [Parvularcula mediterranea]NNU16552.1 class I poly(R)-hydroxyalkanoic acid synthase [Parvularcula mediterranea]
MSKTERKTSTRASKTSRAPSKPRTIKAAADVDDSAIADAPTAKAPAKKAPAKKTAAKKAPVKKTAAKKAPAKKAAAKKTAAKKAPAKKASVKKAAAKKAASKAPAASAAPKKEAPLKDVTAAKAKTQFPNNPFTGDAKIPDYSDMARFARTMADINVKAQDVMRDATERQVQRGRRGAEPTPDPLNVADATTDVMTALSQDPMKVMGLQMSLWDNYTKLFATMADKFTGSETTPVIEPSASDRRFKHDAWTENPALDFVKQSYLILSKWVDDAILAADGIDEATKRRAQFHADQFLSAMSPTNVPALNPDVVDETMATQGANFIKGLENFMADLERGHGELAIRQADLDFFKVGENLATTPGKVVYQNEMMQLIQYSPATEHVAENPMVIFPPWINKFYILDLQAQNSFIRWLVEQGRTVFVVSWVNPGTELKDKSFPDYMRQGVYEALEAATRATGAEKFDTIGYCIGGTLLATTLGYMAQQGDERINTATFFTAQTDFVEAGDLLLFVDDKQLKNMEKQIDASGGVLEGSAMARTFNMLRPNDLIWSAFVDNYYMGKEAKKFDLLHWNADSTRMTKACHLFYLREFYQHNKLALGELEIDGVTIDLSKVETPVFMQAGEKDHIAPPGSVFRSAQLFGGPDVTYMLAGSGHIAGVINHPDKKKYHFRTNDDLPASMEEWVAGAEFHEHSWWPHWIEWLTERSGGKVPARVPGDGELSVIEDAPGSYVKVRAE